MKTVQPDCVELITGGRRYRMPLSPVQPGVTVGRAGAFPLRDVIGDPNILRHEWLSQFVQRSWQGGGQIHESDEATNIERYDEIATLDSRFPGNLCLLPETLEITGPNTTGAMPLGTLRSGGTRTFYMAFGDKICSVNGTSVSAAIATLTEVPIDAGTRFKGSLAVASLIIPQAGGYQIFDGAAAAAEVVTFAPLSFLVTNNVLYALDRNGIIWQNPTGVAADWTNVITINNGSEPLSLVGFRDATGTPSIVVVTDEGLLAVDPGAPAIYTMDVTYPPHPDNTGVAVKWNNDLFTSYALDLSRYTLSTITYIGLARDDGMPSSYLGNLTSVANGWNEILALVAGQDTVGSGATWSLDEEVDLSFPDSSGSSSLMRYDRYGGWHTAWISGGAGSLPTRVMTSSADDEWRIYWGFNGYGYVQLNPRGFENVKQRLNPRFQPSGTLTSSWLDMGNTGTRMILAAVVVRATDVASGQTVRVELQLQDQEQEWITVGTANGDNDDVTENGMLIFRQGAADDLLPDGTTLYEGLEFNQLRYRVTMASDDATLTPKLQAIILVYMPVMGELRTLNFRVDCSNDMNDRGYGLSNRERAELLDGLIGQKFVGIAYRDEWFAVKITGSGGFDATALDWRGDREVSCVETYRL